MGFREDVCEVVKAIPRGQTLSYSRVAALAGRPGAPRAVTRVLNTTRGLPWWRVIRADRTLAVEVAAEQAKRLRAEGVQIEGRRVVAERPSRRATSESRRPDLPTSRRTEAAVVRRRGRPAPRRSARGPG